MNNKKNAIVEYLNLEYFDAKCQLNYKTDYEFLIAVMLSAQTTDISVNKVTEKLFTKYTNLEDLSKASFDDIYSYVKFLGLGVKKAQNILAITNMLVDKYNGRVPQEKNELIKLPGVGNKTANVVRIELFNKQELPVDTHVHRFLKRMGICSGIDNIKVVEEKGKAFFGGENLIKLHHQIIIFGRTKCKSLNPSCINCPLASYCDYYKNKTSK